MRIAIFIPACEAGKTLERVIRRIPQDIYEAVEEILIQDNASHDATLAVATQLAREFHKITVVANGKNLGYGGTKKKAYRSLLEKGYDIVVMVHSDLQHPPECLSDMLQPLLTNQADIVLGSRMSGRPLDGGMPLYKWLGNRFLTITMNLFLGLRLSEYHTGYRAYQRKALERLNLQTCGDGHEISAQILIRAVEQDLRIVEIPVPTYYGTESRSCSFMTSVVYGLDVMKMLILRVNR